jgi:uncharacterized protein YndB with AHSA1/START domain
MKATLPEQEVQTLHIVKETEIDAPVEVVWESVLEEMTSLHPGQGAPMPMKLEPRPGGRWYRDLGNDAGHLWAHVQVIKPPKLLELCGPLFMSYPAISHLQYRLAGQDGQTRLTLTHRAIGLIDPEHATGVHSGWNQILEGIKRNAQRRAGGK